jgi:hypothetical protein
MSAAARTSRAPWSNGFILDDVGVMGYGDKQEVPGSESHDVLSLLELSYDCLRVGPRARLWHLHLHGNIIHSWVHASARGRHKKVEQV